VPVLDGWLAQLPAQQEDLALHLAGKIEQSDVEVFHLHAGGVNFGDGILDAPNRLLALRLAPRQMDDIQQRAAAEKNPVRRLLQLGVHVFNQLLAVDRLPEQRFQNRQEHLRFVEGKGSVGHVSLFYWNWHSTGIGPGKNVPSALQWKQLRGLRGESKMGRESNMGRARAWCTILLTFTCACALEAQDVPVPQLTPGSTRQPASASSDPAQAAQTVALTVAKGAPLQVALDQEVRVKKVGQQIHARIVEPVYAFDRVVVPVGSEIVGEVTKIEAISGGKRTLAALNADCTPRRKVEVGFHELVLADGRRFPLHTKVTPGSGQIIELVTAANAKEKKNGARDMASQKTNQAKQQARQEWDNAMKQLKTPGKVRRLERYGEARLPIHRQYIPAGTLYFAVLEEPLDFGSEMMTTPMASSIGSAIPEGSVVHARLITPLSSATAYKGQDVEAVLSQPLMDGERLILPQGSRLKGTVRQAQPARRMKKNGQLRIAFSELVPPDGLEQKVVATLEGVQAGKDANVKLDSEGGAEATTSKSRYLGTAVSLGLAMVAAGGGHDSDGADGTTGSGAAGGMGGFKVVGMVMGALARSPAFSTSMGAYGAAVSVYSHFIARGREVEFPKNTAMQIGIGTRAPAATPPAHGFVPPTAAPAESAALVDSGAYLE